MDFIGIVKMGHKRYPKKWIESITKDWLSGTYIFLESEEIEDQRIIVIGYIYDIQSAVHTMSGNPYSAEWIRSTDHHL